jgi:hypothetical protein
LPTYPSPTSSRPAICFEFWLLEQALSFALVLHALNGFPYLPLGYAALVLHGRALRLR